MFREGEWVKTARGKVGFILETSEHNHLVYFPKEERLEYIADWKLDICEKTSPMFDEFLIDLALMTRDEDWFKQLNESLEMA